VRELSEAVSGLFTHPDCRAHAAESTAEAPDNATPPVRPGRDRSAKWSERTPGRFSLAGSRQWRFARAGRLVGHHSCDFASASAWERGWVCRSWSGAVARGLGGLGIERCALDDRSRAHERGRAGTNRWPHVTRSSRCAAGSGRILFSPAPSSARSRRSTSPRAWTSTTSTSSILGITPLPRGIDEVGLLDHEHPGPAHDGRVTGMPLIRAASLSRLS
jgi:hypothetical protein